MPLTIYCKDKPLSILPLQEDKPIYTPPHLILDLEREQLPAITYCINESEFLEELMTLIPVIEAGGGIVSDMENNLLMIFRRGKWDLPKGKLELGEDTHTAAIREVEEECGVRDLVITNSEPYKTYHFFQGKKNVWNLKITYWYEMNTEDAGPLYPQIEEEITEVEWISPENIPDKLNNSYASIKHLLKQARPKIVI